jgi:hypothetical protein
VYGYTGTPCASSQQGVASSKGLAGMERTDAGVKRRSTGNDVVSTGMQCYTQPYRHYRPLLRKEVG